MTHHVYFHGLPGSSDELGFLDELRIDCPKVVHPAHWQCVARDTTEPQVSLIGFSLGAFAAIRAAATAGVSISSLHLISPAAPLELGDFLPQMAGAAVFKSAAIHPKLLSALTLGQRMLTAVAPQGIIQLTFATSSGADKTLLDDSGFRHACLAGFHASLVSNRTQYLATICDYVRPWARLIDKVECPVHIYQGTEDTWTPPTMAAALSRRLGDNCNIEMLEGLGHYSTLHHALPRILRRGADFASNNEAPG